jgi:PQ loop repeat
MGPVMLTITQIGGFAGAGLAGAAYVPQISHLVRARCSAGISRLAFGAWLLASLLTTARAVAIGADVFIVLGGVQIVATALVMACVARYKDTPCPVHLPGQPTAKPEWLSQQHGRGTARVQAYVPVPYPRSHAVTVRSGREPDVPAFPSWPGPQTAAVVSGADGAGPSRSRPGTGCQTRHLKETT